MKVAFILSKFPCYDEAFLLREIHAVAATLPVAIVSLRRSRDEVLHEQAKELLDRTLSPPYLLSFDLVRAHLSLLARRPHRYLRALLRLISGNLRSPEFLAKSLLFFPKAVLLARWAEASGVTQLHAGWATYPASVALVISDLTGLPFSFSGHAHDIYVNTTQLPAKLRCARHVTTCTESNRDFLRRLAPEVPEGRIEVVRHGLDLSRYLAESPPAQGLELLSVGTLNPHKGFAELLAGLATLAGQGQDFRCTIVGGGPLEARLRARVDELGLQSRVTLTGALPQSQVIPHYKRSSVFILMAQPEWHWGVPNVIIEALAARNAVVTTRFGSVEELVRDGETGLLVPPRDPGALAAALSRLGSDPRLRSRLAEAGHQQVARDYDIRRTAQIYVRHFQETGGVGGPTGEAPRESA